jgi:hypothetical protein
MLYRGWTIQAHALFAGHWAQYTSPVGRTHQTAACFETGDQAIAYAQAVVDDLLRCELLGLQERHHATAAA